MNAYGAQDIAVLAVGAMYCCSRLCHVETRPTKASHDPWEEGR